MNISRVLWLVVASAGLCAAQPLPRHKICPNGGDACFTVIVTVSADQVQTEIESYANRELRSLGDVSIVQMLPDFRIRFTVLDVRNQAGTPIGYSLAFLFSRRLIPDPKDMKSVNTIMQTVIGDFNISAAIRSAVFSVAVNLPEKISEGEQVLFLGVMSCPSDGLRKCTSDVITDFDTRVLNDERRKARP